MIQAIRGATTTHSNTKEDIKAAAIELYQQILLQNKLKEKQIISIIISTTADITAFYPATALRENGCVKPLLSCIEPQIDGFPPLCIRILIHFSSIFTKKITKVYLNGAKNLISQ